jgi:hypothetical protein
MSNPIKFNLDELEKEFDAQEQQDNSQLFDIDDLEKELAAQEQIDEKVYNPSKHWSNITPTPSTEGSTFTSGIKPTKVEKPYATISEQIAEQMTPVTPEAIAEQLPEYKSALDIEEGRKKAFEENFTTNPEYRAKWFQENVGMSEEEFKAAQQEEFTQRFDNLLPRAEAIFKKNIEDNAIQRGGTGLIRTIENLGSSMAAKSKLDELRGLSASFKHNNLWSGMYEGADLLDVLSGGLADFASEKAYNEALKKQANGEELTEEEQFAIDASDLYDDINETFEVLGGRSGWNKTGKTVGQSAEFTAGMLPTSGLGFATGLMKSLGLKAGWKAVKTAAGNGLRAALGESLKQGGKVLGRGLYNLGLSYTESIPRAAIMPGTYSRYLELRNERLKNGESLEGNWLQDAGRAGIEMTNEIASEIWGSTFIHDSFRAMGKALGIDKAMDAVGLGRRRRTMFGWTPSAATREAMRNLGYSGDYLSEVTSEAAGDVATNLAMGVFFDDAKWEEMKTREYWTTLLGATALQGSAFQTINTLANVPEYKRLTSIQQKRDKAVKDIQSEQLRKDIEMAFTYDDAAEMGKALAAIDWNAYNRIDVANAMDAVRLEVPLRIATGERAESERVAKFAPHLQETLSQAYQGVDANNPIPQAIIVDAVTDEGANVRIMSGDYHNPNAMLNVVDMKTGKSMPILASKVMNINEVSIQQRVQEDYRLMFSTEENVERLGRVMQTLNDLAYYGTMTSEDAIDVVKRAGFTVYGEGSIVTLVNGQQVEIAAPMMSDGHYLVRDANGNASVVGMLDVLQPAMEVVEAQVQIAQEQEQQDTAEATEAVEEAMAEAMPQSPMPEGVAYGEAWVTPQGIGRVLEYDPQTGKVHMDINLSSPVKNNIENEEIIEVDVADLQRKPSEAEMTEARNRSVRRNALMIYDETSDAAGAIQEVEEVAQPVEQAAEVTEQAPQEVPSMEDVPTTADGAVDYDAITDADMYAKLLTQDLGSKEEALGVVNTSIEAYEAEIADMQSKKEKSTTKAVAKKKQIEAMQQQLDVLNQVRDILTPQEMQETPMTEVEQIAETPQVEEIQQEPIGLVQDDFTATLPKGEAELIDSLARSLGLSVEFVDKVPNSDSNAQILGNKVLIVRNKRNRDKAIKFLVGHEFTHRMQDLSPEAYAEFKAAVKEYMGEELYNTLLQKEIAKYREHNIYRTQEQLEDEVIADFAGSLAFETDALDSFIAAHADKKSMWQAILDVLRAIREWILKDTAYDTAEARALQNTIDKLETLFQTASEKVAEGATAQNAEARNSEKEKLGVPFKETDNQGKEVKKTTLGERSDADSHNSSSEGLPLSRSERLSGNTLAPLKDDAKIGKDSQIIQRNIKKILNKGGFEEDVKTESQAVRFLGKAFNMQKSDSSHSYYGDYYEGDYLVDDKVVHLRISTHPATGDRMGNADADHKVSIVIRKNGEHNSRGEHDGYEEIIYEPTEISPRDAANAVVNGVKTLIETGEYVDVTGKAHRTTYPTITPNGEVLFSLKDLDPVAYDDAGNIIPLSERFNPEKADVRYSAKDNPSLVGVHNISLEKLRKVIKMGGLANPSVAVIDADKQTHEDYGEYSLILPKNMVDARQGKNAGTWAGDAWTPTYPQITKRMSKDKDISRYYKDTDVLPEAMRNMVRLDFDSFMDGRNANALAYWYLFDKGVAPELVDVPARYPVEIVDALNEATNGSFSMFGLSAEERARCLDAFVAYKYKGDRATYDADMVARKERLENFAKNHDKGIVRKKAQEDLDAINEYGFDYDEVSRFIRDVEWDVRHKGETDVDATIKASMDYIAENNLGAEYDAWRNSLDERYGIEEYIFDGYTNSGTRRYLPHTVENASKWMKKQGRQGAVATFPSFGTFVAVSIPKMTTLESIRKRKNLLGKSKEEYDAFREKWENVYFELGKKLQPDAKGFDDYGYWRLIEAVGQKNPKEYIKKQYNIELSAEDVNTLNDMLDAIRTEYPARYFETKFERPLQLNDFVAAVVPDDVPMDVWGRLNDANVKIFEYEKGNSKSRAEAMQKATATEGVRFSVKDTFYSNAENAVRLIKQEKATPEQWLKMIEKNGGLKAGEDKWLGLSDWLKASDKKTLTKDEVLDYIHQNQIQIEEVNYAEVGSPFIDRATRKLEAEMKEIGIEAMREKYPDFDDFFEVFQGELVWSEQKASEGEYEDYIIENNILDVDTGAEAINETRLGYTTNGLDNNREIALTVPTIEPWNESDAVHFGDAGGGRAVAWIRFGETTALTDEAIAANKAVEDYLASMREKYGSKEGEETDAMTADEISHLQSLTAKEIDSRENGLRVLVIDEIQSKRHQEGREKGYKTIEDEKLRNAQGAEIWAMMQKYNVARPADLRSVVSAEDAARLDEFARHKFGEVPSAPFEKNWAELAMKRMLRYAAENGYDKVAWTTGEQQADRYNMSTSVSKISRRDNNLVEGKRFMLGGNTVLPHKITINDEGIVISSTLEGLEGKPLADVVGKEMAVKMMQMEDNTSLEDADLKVGGSGMKAFYDQMLPSFVRKYAKKWGATVGEVTMPNLEENNTMHSVDVTPAMRESVMQGQPLFSLKDNQKAETIAYKARRIGRVYGVNTPMIVAVTPDDYRQGVLETGVEEKYFDPETSGVYLHNVGYFILNSAGIETDEDLVDTIIHEESHRLTHNDKYWQDIAGVVALIDGNRLERFSEDIFGKKMEPMNVADEIIATFVGQTAVIQDGKGRYLLRGYISGEISIDEVISIFKGKYSQKIKENYADIVDAMLPFIRTNIETIKIQSNDKGRINGGDVLISGRGYRPSVEETAGDRGLGNRGVQSPSIGENVRHSQEVSNLEAPEQFARQSLKDNVGDEVAERLERIHQDNIARINNLYDDRSALVERRAAEIARQTNGAYKRSWSNAQKVDFLFPDGITAAPIADQVLADIARGQKLRWNDSPDGRKRGLSTELGLDSARAEGMGAVTNGATTYVEDYIEQLYEANNGYERGLDDQDIRNAVLDMFSRYPSPKAALQELEDTYLNEAESESAEEALRHIDIERENALREENRRYAEDLARYAENPQMVRDEFFASDMQAEFIKEEANAIYDIERKVRTLQKRLDNLRSKQRVSRAEQKQIIDEIKQEIRKALNPRNARYFNSIKLRSLINTIDASYTIKGMARAMDGVLSTFFDVNFRLEKERRDALTKSRINFNTDSKSVESYLEGEVAAGHISKGTMERILADRWRGVNSRGVSVAKFIDGDTAVVMDFIAQNIKWDESKEPSAQRYELVDKAIDMGKEKNYSHELIGDLINAAYILEDYWLAEQMLKVADSYSAELEQANKNIAELEEEIIATQNFHSAGAERDEIIAGLQRALDEALRGKQALHDQHFADMPNIIAAMNRANNSVAAVLATGRVKLSQERYEKKKHEAEIVQDALDDLTNYGNPEEIAALDKLLGISGINRQESWLEKTKQRMWDDYIWSLDYMLRSFGRFAPDGTGRVYMRFMPALNAAWSDYRKNLSDIQKRIDEKIRSLWGNKSKSWKRGIGHNPFNVMSEKAEEKHIATITYTKTAIAWNTSTTEGGVVEVSRDKGTVTETMDLSLSQAMYMLASWGQSDGRMKLEANGIKQEHIAQVREAMQRYDERYLDFMDWVIADLLPSLRERYNEVHKQLFGTYMTSVDNYFPLKVTDKGRHIAEDVSQERSETTPLSINPGAIINRTHNTNMIDLKQNFFKVLAENISEMERWATMMPVATDINALMSNGTVRNYTKAAFGPSFHTQLRDRFAVATGQGIRSPKLGMESTINTAMRYWASTKIGFRFFTAFKQIASLPAILTYSMSPGFLKEVGVNMVTGLTTLGVYPFRYCIDKFPMFRERVANLRAGDITLMKAIEEGSTQVAEQYKGTFKTMKTTGKMLDAFAQYLGKAGFAANMWVDALSSGIIAMSVYNYEYKRLQKQGYTAEQADKMAIFLAENTFNQTQQSAEYAYLAPGQLSPRMFDKAITVFQNSTFLYSRQGVQGLHEMQKSLFKTEKMRDNIQRREARRLHDLYISQGLSEEEAQAKAAQEAREIATREWVKSAVHGAGGFAWGLFLGNYIFNFIGNLFAYCNFWDDEDERNRLLWEDVKWNLLFSPVRGFPGGGSVMGYIQYGRFEPFGAMSEFSEDIAEIYKMLDKVGEDGFNEQIAWLVLEYAGRWGIGVDANTVTNLYKGIESMVESGMSTEAIMQFLNAPQSQMRLIADKRREGETFKQYLDRVRRVQTKYEVDMSKVPYYTDEGAFIGSDESQRMTEKQEKVLRTAYRQYEEAYRKDVLQRTRPEITDWDDTEKRYKKVAKNLGWKPNKNPNDDRAFNEAGDYIGRMPRDVYEQLYFLQGEVAYHAREAARFLGNESDYAKYLDSIYMNRKQLIQLYDDNSTK